MMKKSITVYLIEDYKPAKTEFREVLNGLKDICCIGNSDKVKEGLKAIIKQTPDILLIDINLKDMNTLYAIRRIKDLMPELKIIVLTSENKSLEAVMSLSAGALGYCMKERDVLEKAIRTVYSGACFLDGSILGYVLKYLPPVDESMSPDKPNTADNKYMLSKRELEVLKYLVNGKNNLEISEEMFISVYTTKAYIGNILKKLSVSDRLKAVVKAIREQLV
ncbi:response regulator transcription factor [bacterium]|nr:response regulator transcription factor [bacterium]